MCLAIPGKILETSGDEILDRLGRVEFSGIIKQVSLMLVPSANVGDYVLVHAGVAISQLNEEQAQLSLQTIQDMAEAAQPTRSGAEVSDHEVH